MNSNEHHHLDDLFRELDGHQTEPEAENWDKIQKQLHPARRWRMYMIAACQIGLTGLLCFTLWNWLGTQPTKPEMVQINSTECKPPQEIPDLATDETHIMEKADLKLHNPHASRTNPSNEFDDLLAFILTDDEDILRKADQERIKKLLEPVKRLPVVSALAFLPPPNIRTIELSEPQFDLKIMIPLRLEDY